MQRPDIIDAGTQNGRPFVRISNIGNFSVFKTFDCGQCFRFDPTASSDWPDSPDDRNDADCSVSGIAFGKCVTFRQSGNDMTILGANETEYASIWERYLSLDTDYGEIDRIITNALDERGNDVMRRAAESSAGIRLLRQDPWETLCSFIVSQNNNIPRIKKIIAALCEKYGDRTEDGLGFAFPTARALADAGEEAIFQLKTGFRAKYIADAARRVADGELDLDATLQCEDYDECERTLMQVKGVGPKVAACALLFGFGKTEAYPIDTWMKKVAAKYFDNGPDPKKFGKYAGVAQQYLFYMERYLGGQ